MKISIVLSVSLCMFVLGLTGHTMLKLMLFLSNFHPSVDPVGNQLVNVIVSLLVNTSLAFLFIFQHSYLKTNKIATFLNRYRISSCIARSIYVIFTSTVLQIIFMCWRPISDYWLWNIETENTLHWWFFSIIHFSAWICIYGGSVILDLPDLIGVKQIYYYYLNIPEATDIKSAELHRLYSHKRHPSFVGFFSILWITPVMNLDRALMAAVLTVYMVTAWEPTVDDKRYHQRQMLQKQQEIAYINRRKKMNSGSRNFRG